MNDYTSSKATYGGYEGDVDESLNDIRSINMMNDTVAAVWDLNSPSQSCTIFASRQRRTERFSMFADRRARVAPQHIRPGGKYRSICKLIMGYSRANGTEYTGTGWLIADDTIVTAGHCLYDNKGGYLQYVKAYIGYVGPESDAKHDRNCQMRLGKYAAAPAEYIKTYSLVHDVGFIKLERPFDDVEPFNPEDTPITTKGIELGVVGYPSDIDDGNVMYEHWATTKIDISRNGYLSYEIETAGGESGSPVLQRTPYPGDIRPIGVHAEGGFPNSGSAIGPYGNTFADYIIALETKSTNHFPPHVTSARAHAPAGIRKLEYIRVGSTEKSDLQHSHARVCRDEDLLFSTPVAKDMTKTHAHAHAHGYQTSNGLSQRHFEALHDLENLISPAEPKPCHGARPMKCAGFCGRHCECGLTRPRTATVCTHIPAKLSQREFKESGAITNRTQDQLLDEALHTRVHHSDVQTTFFINLKPEGLHGRALADLHHVVKNVNVWQSWASSLAAVKTQEKINSGDLSSAHDGRSMAKRSTYYSTVFDFLMRGSTWLAKTYDETETRHFECRSLDLHKSLLDAALAGFHVPHCALKSLHAALCAISESIKLASKRIDHQQMQYFIMLTKFEWQSVTQTVQPVIRVISFKTDASLTQYTVMKSDYTDVKLDFTYNQYQCEFNDEVFSHLRARMNNRLVEQGVNFMDDANTMNILMPSMSKNASVQCERSKPSPSRDFVQHDNTAYEKIAESLESIASVHEDLKQGPFSETAMSVVDAGIVSQIGTSLSRHVEESVRKAIFAKSMAAVSMEFPSYWQHMGCLTFKQLFPKIAVPTSLQLEGDTESLTKEYESLKKKTQKKSTRVPNEYRELAQALRDTTTTILNESRKQAQDLQNTSTTILNEYRKHAQDFQNTSTTVANEYRKQAQALQNTSTTMDKEYRRQAQPFSSTPTAISNEYRNYAQAAHNKSTRIPKKNRKQDQAQQKKTTFPGPNITDLKAVYEKYPSEKKLASKLVSTMVTQDLLFTPSTNSDSDSDSSTSDSGSDSNFDSGSDSGSGTDDYLHTAKIIGQAALSATAISRDVQKSGKVEKATKSRPTKKTGGLHAKVEQHKQYNRASNEYSLEGGVKVYEQKEELKPEPTDDNNTVLSTAKPTPTLSGAFEWHHALVRNNKPNQFFQWDASKTLDLSDDQKKAIDKSVFLHGLTKIVSEGAKNEIALHCGESCGEADITTSPSSGTRITHVVQESMTELASINSAWVAIPDIGGQMQTGEQVLGPDELNETTIRPISFKTRYSSPPAVAVWIKGLHFPASKNPNQYISVTSINITSQGCDIKIRCSLDKAQYFSFGWVAYTHACPQMQSGVCDTRPGDVVFRTNAFSHPPTVFYALNSFYNCPHAEGLSIGVEKEWVKRDGMKLDTTAPANGSVVDDRRRIKGTWIAVW